MEEPSMKRIKLSFFAPYMASIAVAFVGVQAHGQGHSLGGQPLGQEITLDSGAHGTSIISGSPVITNTPPATIVSNALPPSPAVSSGTISETPLASGSYVGDLPIDGSVSGDTIDGGSIGGTFQGRSYGQPDLFFNFYSQGHSNQLNAQLYTSPGPVPPYVGNTFYTYQPFYPHEMLYWHKDKYHRYYDNGRGMNRTRATYYSPPVRQAISNVYWNYLRLPR